MNQSETSGADYRERVWPPIWVWILAVGMGSALAIAYGAAYGPSIGLLVALPSISVPLIGLILASPALVVTGHRFHAGRAVLPIAAVSRCAPLESDQMAQALRLGDPTLFRLVRPWTVRTGLLVELTDPEDPHTAWLVSTRHPHRLAESLRSRGVNVLDKPMR